MRNIGEHEEGEVGEGEEERKGRAKKKEAKIGRRGKIGICWQRGSERETH